MRIAIRLVVPVVMLSVVSACRVADRGAFESETRVGGAGVDGSMEYDATSDMYTLMGGGQGIHGERDEFYYAWRRAAGDLLLTANLEFEDTGGRMLTKAGWMIRASLNDDSPYAAALVMGDGLITLQYREVEGGPTHSLFAGVRAPARLRLERTDSLYSLFLDHGREDVRVVGNVLLPLPDEVYVGLAVSASDADHTQTVQVANVRVEELGVPDERVLESTLETINVGTQDRRVIRQNQGHFEAPNWSPDGESLIFNQEGRLYSIGIDSKVIRPIDTDFADRINNDHGFSPDGAMMAISHAPEGEGSVVYTMPAEGGMPMRITEQYPSYWHGWSPDGQFLAYVGLRDGDYDIYVIPAKGGEEIRLTNVPGLDDGPDYSPDGEYIYFNSVRTRSMKIWRMGADGSSPEQLTFQEEYADWFPHPSPDGRWVVFLSYTGDVEGHPPNKPVTLRIMPASGGEPQVIARLFGGQGTINVPSWSPDSQSIAFVSYRLVAPEY